MALTGTIDSFRFDGDRESKPLFSSIEIRIALGRIVSLVGASAVGKSTLGRLLAGLHESHECFEGHVTCDGEVVHQPQSPVSLVLQDYRRAVFPWMTVKDNLRLGVPKVHKASSLSEVVEFLGLESALDAYPHQLSGGQLQRVQIGRALASGSQYLVLDEATSSLDLAVRRKVYRQLNALAHERNIGLLIITHEIDEAVSIADTVVLMRQGNAGAELVQYDGLRKQNGEAVRTAHDEELQSLCSELEEALDQ